jgi:hypothetical protein
LQLKAANRPDRKEAVSARPATISGDLRNSKKPGAPAADTLSGDVLKIEVATFTAVRVKQKGQRD